MAHPVQARLWPGLGPPARGPHRQICARFAPWATALLLALLIGCAPSAPQIPASRDVRFRVGDDPAWASPDFDDRDWATGTFADAPRDVGVLWARLRVTSPEADSLGVSVSAAAAREVHWDGIAIGRAGQVGASWEQEQPGPLDLVVAVPSDLAAPGRHTIAVRFSTFRRPPGTNGLLLNIGHGELTELVLAPLRSVGLPLVFLGGFLMVGSYFVALYFVDRRRRPYLAMGLLCVAVALLLVAECWRDAVGYDYTGHVMRLRMIEGLTAAVGILLVGAYLLQFRSVGAGWWIGGLALASAVAGRLIHDHEALTYTLFAISLSLAALLAGWAWTRRKPGAVFALGGALACLGALFVTGRSFMEGAFFPAFGTLVAGALASLSLQTRVEAKRFQGALAAKARLEAELLKKHLQPHFLMNTLTSIMEWVETDPPRGARALEALATELRSLTQVSGRSVISMGEELALCRAHLAVMGFRQGVDFRLESSGVDPSSPIPPAVLHTGIENAITHNAYDPGEVVFRLTESLQEGRRILQLRTPLAGAARSSVVEGGGTRYVRARLEESAPGDWSLTAGPDGGDWLLQLDLPVGGTV